MSNELPWQKVIRERDWRGVKIDVRWHRVTDINKIPDQIIFSKRYCNTNHRFLFDYAKFGTLDSRLHKDAIDTIRLYFEGGSFDEWRRDVYTDEYAPFKLVKEATQEELDKHD